MLKELPWIVPVLFLATAFLTIFWFYKASKSVPFLMGMIVWTGLQMVLGYSGVFEDTQSVPPRLMLFGVFPTLLIILAMFLTKSGRAFIDGMNLQTITYAHTIRIPVEIVLFLLFQYGWVSKLMTFEGTNFDIISGLTAPLVAYFAFRGNTTNTKLLIFWNVLCLLLLLNVVITAVFAIPSPFQKLAFDQPNIAVLRFPFSLLPAVVVPLVLFGHLIAFRQLLGSRKK